MKKFLLLVVLALTLIIPGGCGGTVEAYSDPAQTIAAGVNQEFTIALDSNPTTGYTWQESHDAAFLTLVEKKIEPGAKGKQGLVGAGGVENFRFKSLKAGKTQVTMTYKRPWETQSARQMIFTVDIK